VSDFEKKLVRRPGVPPIIRKWFQTNIKFYKYEKMILFLKQSSYSKVSHKLYSCYDFYLIAKSTVCLMS